MCVLLAMAVAFESIDTESNSIQAEIDELDEELQEGVSQLEQKFQAKKRPLYQKRDKLLAKVPNFWEVLYNNTSSCTLSYIYIPHTCCSYSSQFDTDD